MILFDLIHVYSTHLKLAKPSSLHIGVNYTDIKIITQFRDIMVAVFSYRQELHIIYD